MTDDVTWRVDLIAATIPVPVRLAEAETSAHEAAVGLVDAGGAPDLDMARAVIQGIVNRWPEHVRPSDLVIAQEAMFVLRAPKFIAPRVDPSPNGKCAALAGRIEDAIAGRLESLSWPWPSVGKLTQSLMPGAVTLVVGNPGASKSFMLLQGVVHWLGEGHRVALYELEENHAFWLTRLLAQIAECGDLTDPNWIRNHPDRARESLATHGGTIATLADALTTAPPKGITLEGLAQWIEEQCAHKYRIIVCDPITAAAEGTTKPWEAAQKFMGRAKRAAVDHGASLILATHGKKRDGQAKGPPDLDSLAGGSAYARFASCVLWLEQPADEGHQECIDSHLRAVTGYVNRRLRILKAREGRGTGMALGMQFLGESLTMVEHGVIVNKPAAKKAVQHTANAAHQAERLRQKPSASEDVFADET